MYACLECEKRLPPRAKGGHREREYCSSRCRQRAYRKQKKQSQEIEHLIKGVYALPDPQATRDRWRFERAGLLQQYKLLEAQCNVAQAEIRVLENKNTMLQDLLADKEAEMVRLTVLLESQGKHTR
jgi:hypothetical protein